MESRFLEVSMSCRDLDKTLEFYGRVFGAEVIFTGTMLGERYARVVCSGITMAFREDTKKAEQPLDRYFRDHLGFKVPSLKGAIAELKDKGVRFVLEPADVEGLRKPSGALTVDYVAPPLSLQELGKGTYRHDVAMFLGPDGEIIELNEVHTPAEVTWFDV